MKRFTLALVAVVFLSAGTASADRGWWFGSGLNAWSTIVNVTNYGTADAAVTVTFFNVANSVIGSTVKTLATNASWNFSTGSIGSVSASSFYPAAGGSTRGAVRIQSDQGRNVIGFTTVMDSTASAGFNFRIPDILEQNAY